MQLQNKMLTEQEAVNVLTSVCKQLVLKLDEHAQVQAAIFVLSPAGKKEIAARVKVANDSKLKLIQDKNNRVKRKK